jgi:hypothetical protein
MSAMAWRVAGGDWTRIANSNELRIVSIASRWRSIIPITGPCSR